MDVQAWRDYIQEAKGLLSGCYAGGGGGGGGVEEEEEEEEEERGGGRGRRMRGAVRRMW